MILSICQQKDLSASPEDCKWVLDMARCFIFKLSLVATFATMWIALLHLVGGICGISPVLCLPSGKKTLHL